MKKIASITLMIMSFFSVMAQEEETFQKNTNRHEFRIDAAEILIIPNIDIQYEYVISKFSGAGLSVSYSLDDNFSQYQHYSINPYFRQYFFNKQDFGARGVFVEGLLKVAGGKDNEKHTEIYETNEDGIRFYAGNRIEKKDWTNIGVGLALGKKWVSDNGFVLEISLGGGRYFVNDQGSEGFVRGGISLGYRFF